jgi:hypothetical protein
MKILWQRIIVIMDMDTQTRQIWCAMILARLLQPLQCNSVHGEIVLREELADGSYGFGIMGQNTSRLD